MGALGRERELVVERVVHERAHDKAHRRRNDGIRPNCVHQPNQRQVMDCGAERSDSGVAYELARHQFRMATRILGNGMTQQNVIMKTRLGQKLYRASAAGRTKNDPTIYVPAPAIGNSALRIRGRYAPRLATAATASATIARSA